MAVKVRDDMLEEIDEELRSINARLRKVLSRTDALLKEFKEEPEGEEEVPSETTESSEESSTA